MTTWFRLRWFGIPLLSCFFCVPVARAAAPSLELLSISPTRTVQLRLHGQDGLHYAVEISTNLTSWQSASSVTLNTVGGVTVFSHDASAANDALFYRAKQIATISNVVVHPQISPIFSIDSVATADGGTVELTTPDLRRIVLSIPPGCVIAPQEFTMTLITNIDSLPFARGTFGAVRLEPEDFALSGAASLEVYFPPGVDTREVVSYEANNDGSTFHLMMDRIAGDHVLIPVARFATYGSSLATASELDAVLNPPLAAGVSLAGIGKHGPIPGDDCPDDPPDYSPFDTSQFPPSTYECFHDKVARALLVRADLRRFLRCAIQKNMTSQLLQARQQQLVGAPDNGSEVLANALTSVCPIYQSRIEPLWEEAQSNCALGVVLLDFMLGFERQLQLLGVANAATCNYTVFGNLAKVCASARECLGETALCCVMGNKGPQKYNETIKILRQFELLGDNLCFPLQEDDPQVQAVFETCLTNAWLGTFRMTQTGASSTTDTQGDSTTVDAHSVEALYSGSVWESVESITVPGFGKSLTLKVLGDAAVKLHDQLTSTLSIHCAEGGQASDVSQFNTESVGVSNVFGSYEKKTNDVATTYGGYGVAILIKPDQTYQLTCGSDLLLTVKVKEIDVQRTVACDGSVSTSTNSDTNQANGVFPAIGVPEVRPMPDPNRITGSFQTVDSSGTTHITTRFEWSFTRQTNAPALGP